MKWRGFWYHRKEGGIGAGAGSRLKGGCERHKGGKKCRDEKGKPSQLSRGGGEKTTG